MAETLKLLHPFTHEGERYTEFNMRNPIVMDHLAVENIESELLAEITLFGNLAGVSPEVLKYMATADLKAMQKLYKDFTSGKKAESSAQS